MENSSEKLMAKGFAAIEGSLLGLMAGDAMGLPFEGLSPRRVAKMRKVPLRHQLLFGKGMVSDDTEHAVMTAASLVKHWGDWDKVRCSLGWRLRWWFSRLPAGMGLATGRAMIKLWLGFSSRSSGVHSAGNGPSMRAPIIGVALGDEPQMMLQVVKASTEITHSDPKAVVAALAIAQAAFLASRSKYVDLKEYRSSLEVLLEEQDPTAASEFLYLLDLIKEEQNGEPVNALDQLAQALQQEKGISGYSYHTVPMVICAWLMHQDDFEGGIAALISMGGDTDTTCAILGGIIGSRVGKIGIPESWLANLVDWPWNVNMVSKVSSALAQCKESNSSGRVVWVLGPLVLLRNLFFLAIVLLHGFRRLLPPY